MSSKRNKELFRKIFFTLIGLGLVAISGFLYNSYYEEPSSIDLPNNSYDSPAPLPPITPERGIVITDYYYKDPTQAKPTCIARYNITPERHIYIERFYPEENKKEYLILRKLNPRKDYKKLYKLIQNSTSLIKPLDPQVLSNYNTPKETFRMLKRETFRMNYDPTYLTLGIFYRAAGQQTEKLVGKVTISHQKASFGRKKFSQGAYGSYWVGQYQYTQVKGVAYLAFRALVDHMIFRGNIRKAIHLVIKKDNIKSIRVAEKLNMIDKKYPATKFFSKEQFKRNYPTIPIENAWIFRLTPKKWKERNWPSARKKNP